MFDRFTDRARKVMQLANQDAQRFNHIAIGSEHLLLGLVKEGAGIPAKVIRNLGIDLRQVRLEVEKLVQAGQEMLPLGNLPLTPLAERVIEYAKEEAKTLGHNYIGCEHLFLGLLREETGVAWQVLKSLGLTNAREEVLRLLDERSQHPGIFTEIAESKRLQQLLISQGFRLSEMVESLKKRIEKLEQGNTEEKNNA